MGVRKICIAWAPTGVAVSAVRSARASTQVNNAVSVGVEGEGLLRSSRDAHTRIHKGKREEEGRERAAEARERSCTPHATPDREERMHSSKRERARRGRRREGEERGRGEEGPRTRRMHASMASTALYGFAARWFACLKQIARNDTYTE